MENFPSWLSLGETSYNFSFWAVAENPTSKKKTYSLYEATEYGVEKKDFVPTLKFVEQSEFDEFTKRADRLGISYTVLNGKKVGLSDPEVHEFDVVKAPVYKLVGYDFIKVEDEPFYYSPFPTERMIDAAYDYANKAKRKIIEEFLEEKLADLKEDGCVCIPKCRFFPSYYLDTNKYLVKNIRYLYNNITYVRSYISYMNVSKSYPKDSKVKNYVSHERETKKMQAI